jgi:hypothetical protein
MKSFESTSKLRIFYASDINGRTRIWIFRSALEENARTAVEERRVDDVRVAGDPADVCDASEDVVRVVVAEYVLVAEGRVHEVAGRAVSDAFWGSSAACNCFFKYTKVI